MSKPQPPRVPRRRATTFRPRFTLMILYLAFFFLVFALFFALPDLVAGARQLPPGGPELSPEELAQAREIARTALGGRIPIALAAAVLATGLGAWSGRLPGLRETFR